MSAETDGMWETENITVGAFLHCTCWKGLVYQPSPDRWGSSRPGLYPSLPNSQVSPAPSLKCMQVTKPLGSSQYVKYMSWNHPELTKEIVSYMYQDLPVIGL